MNFSNDEGARKCLAAGREKEERSGLIKGRRCAVAFAI
jgi:hypothetical protein